MRQEGMDGMDGWMERREKEKEGAITESESKWRRKEGREGTDGSTHPQSIPRMIVGQGSKGRNSGNSG